MNKNMRIGALATLLSQFLLVASANQLIPTDSSNTHNESETVQLTGFIHENAQEKKLSKDSLLAEKEMTSPAEKAVLKQKKEPAQISILGLTKRASSFCIDCSLCLGGLMGVVSAFEYQLLLQTRVLDDVDKLCLKTDRNIALRGFGLCIGLLLSKHGYTRENSMQKGLFALGVATLVTVTYSYRLFLTNLISSMSRRR